MDLDKNSLTMLIVGADDNLFAEIKQTLSTKYNQLITFEYVRAGSYEEYLEVERAQKSIDAAIINMDMQQALDVVRICNYWNPVAVKIGYANKLTIEDIVPFMRNGGYDCRELTEEKSLENIKTSMTEGLRAWFIDCMPTSIWLEQNLPALVKKYPNKYVAFIDGIPIPVDSDSMDSVLRKRVAGNYPESKIGLLLLPETY